MSDTAHLFDYTEGQELSAPGAAQTTPELADTYKGGGDDGQGTAGSEQSPTFEDFYAAYPRHVARRAAEKAWATVTRKTDPAVIVQAARRFALSLRGTDQQFIPHPASWLNAGRWVDEPPAPAEPVRPQVPDFVPDPEPVKLDPDTFHRCLSEARSALAQRGRR